MQSRRVLSSPHLPLPGVGRELRKAEMSSPTATPQAWGKNPDPACVTSLPLCLWAPLSKALCPAPAFHRTGRSSLCSAGWAHLTLPLFASHLWHRTTKPLLFIFSENTFSAVVFCFFPCLLLVFLGVLSGFFLELASTEQHHQGNSSVSASAWQFASTIPVLSPLLLCLIAK